MIDFDGINAAARAALPELLSEWFPAGKRLGNEYVLGDLRGSPGRSLSINIRSGKWADFSSDLRGGDPISLCAAAFHGKDRVAAARDLGVKLGITGGSSPDRTLAPPPTSKPTEPEEHWESFNPPDTAVAPSFGGFDVVYPYRDADGEPTRYVCRKNSRGDAKKIIIPLTYGDLNGVIGWHKRHPNSPKSLYGLDRLASMPDRTVIICEGEKAADAAQIMLPNHPCVTWSAGTNNVKPNDWSVLDGRRVIIWPDNDETGHKAAAQIREIIAPTARSVEILNIADLPDGADAADISPEDPVAWLLEHLRPEEPPMEECPPQNDYDERQESAPASTEENIIPLGHDRGTYYYLSTATGQVEAVQAAQHSRSMLSHLASEAYYWQRTRFINKSGIDWNAAADDLRVRCRAQGIFNPDRLRGRGAWLDDGRSVLHIGDKVLLDGTPAGLMVPNSYYVYEHSPRLDMDISNPLTSSEAKGLMDVCVAAPWESPEHMGRLLAGWCVVAPVCGAMPWRPHLWITSEPGGGKSWMLDNIIKPIVGPIALEVQSKTTEAGIRQTLGCDARPVIFDEAETQNERDRDRVQLVLDLARQASNEEGAAIIKGSANGKAMQYHIRSMFVFSSINVGMSQAADESRTVVLTLSPDRDEAVRSRSFKRLKAMHAAMMAPGFSGRLLARTLSLLPVIRANAVVFAEAIARSGQARRVGDTYGVLLAGAWSLRSRAIATPTEADTFVNETKWVKEAVVKAGVDPEWKRALTTLLQHRTRVVNGNGRVEDVPIGELIRSNAGARVDGAVHATEAKIALSRMGMRIKTDEWPHVLQIANHSSMCADVFSKTPWAASWAATLTRMPGAKRNAGNARLAGTLTRIFSIPIGDLTLEDGDD